MTTAFTLTLNDSLEALAEYLKVSASELIEYAAADRYTGWDGGEGAWPMGSLWTPEGQTLYALIRIFDCQTIVECGTWRGCSATHMAQACKDKGSGQVTTVDIYENTGDMIPNRLRPLVTQVFMKGEDYLATLPDDSLDMIYEDTYHGRDMVAAVWTVGVPKLKPGGLFVSHDALHGQEGVDICNGVEDAGITDYITLLVPPSDCGLLIWRKVK